MKGDMASLLNLTLTQFGAHYWQKIKNRSY